MTVCSFGNRIMYIFNINFGDVGCNCAHRNILFLRRFCQGIINQMMNLTKDGYLIIALVIPLVINGSGMH